jgi:hypothetical protein
MKQPEITRDNQTIKINLPDGGYVTSSGVEIILLFEIMSLLIQLTNDLKSMQEKYIRNF